MRAEGLGGGRVFCVEYGETHAELPAFVASELAHPTKLVGEEVLGLVAAYDGFTPAAYPGAERWQGKDKIFEVMRSCEAIGRTSTDALLRFATPGFVAAALAGLIEAPTVAIIGYLATIAERRPPVNLAYKINDCVNALLGQGGTLNGAQANSIEIILESIRSDHPGEAHFLDQVGTTLAAVKNAKQAE